MLGGRGRLCAELKRYAARPRQTAPDCAVGADWRRLPRPLCELCGLPRPGVGRGLACGGGWLCGCAAAPFRVCAAQFAGRPKTGVAAAPAKARGSTGPPLAGCGPPCGGGQPLPACGRPRALFPVPAGGAPSRARRGVGRAVRPGRRAVVLLCCVPAAAKAPVFSARGAGYEKTPRAVGNAAAAAKGLRRLRAA